MVDRDRLNIPPSDVPPPDSVTNDLRTRAWRRDLMDREDAVWPLLAVAAAVVIVFLFVMNMIGDAPNTQVSQNAERPAITTQPPTTSPPVPQ